MRTVFIVISTILTTASVVPYIIDTFKRRTKPRLVSWFTWALLAAISAVASFSDHQYPAAILSLFGVAQCGAVFILGLLYEGERGISRFDIGCQIAAFAGLGLWAVFNTPALAIWAVIAIDMVGSLPTLRHAWRKPEEETLSTFLLSGTAPVFTVFAATSFQVTSVANPIWLILINYSIVLTILVSRRREQKLHYMNQKIHS
jgi:hypothetical protein